MGWLYITALAGLIVSLLRLPRCRPGGLLLLRLAVAFLLFRGGAILADRLAGMGRGRNSLAVGLGGRGLFVRLRLGLAYGGVVRMLSMEVWH